MAPASLVMLVRSFARHRRPLGVGIAGTGVLLMVVHYVSHIYDGTHGDEPLMYTGAVLLALGAFIDWRAGRAVRRSA
ncbi:MAG: MerC family mercury resistance protein [Armatimonadota bacterium]